MPSSVIWTYVVSWKLCESVFVGALFPALESVLFGWGCSMRCVVGK